MNARIVAAAALLLACACNAGKPSEASLALYPVRGIDVSHHQGTIDWPAVAHSGIGFAFIKATEGATHRDTSFARNWAGAGAAHIGRGAYHFFTFCTTGAEQARNFRQVAPVEPHTLPPAVDVEFIGNCSAWTSIDAIRSELRTFLSLTKSAYGPDVVIYVTEESYQRIIAGAVDPKRLWVRDTWREPSQSWLFWQHADDGHVPGIGPAVDLNVFRGTKAELGALR